VNKLLFFEWTTYPVTKEGVGLLIERGTGAAIPFGPQRNDWFKFHTLAHKAIGMPEIENLVG